MSSSLSIQNTITYPHDCACQITEVFELPALASLKIMMNEQHKHLHQKSNRVEVLTHYCENVCAVEEMKVAIRAAIAANPKLIEQTLNEPTFRCFEFIEHSGIPPPGSSIFVTNATADSCHDCGMIAALKIMNKLTSDIDVFNTSNVTMRGYTGVSCSKPKHEPVYFNPHTPYGEDWEALSWDMAQQMFKLSDSEHDKYTHVYHWGCISQNWTRNPLGNYVSNWKVYEHWNLLNTMAMVWHGVATLKQGGQMILKVRIFRGGETLGLCALVAALFDSYKIIDNARQQCSFAVVIYNGFKFSLKEEGMATLRKCMSYKLSDIYCNDLFLTNAALCQQFLVSAQLVRDQMVKQRAITSTVLLVSLQSLNTALRKRDSRVLFQIVQPLFIDAFGSYHGNHLFQELLKIMKEMSNDDRMRLDMAMSSKWMHDNV
jgi:hypothetical protein